MSKSTKHKDIVNDKESAEESIEDTFSILIQDFKHIYQTKESRQWPFREKLPNSYLQTHDIVEGVYNPIQTYIALCDDPTNEYFFANDPRLRYPFDKMIEMPFPSLPIRPILPKYVQGISPSGYHITIRAKEQVEFWKEYEKTFAYCFSLLSTIMVNALDRSATVLRIIRKVTEKLLNNDEIYINQVRMANLQYKDMDLKSRKPRRLPYINYLVDPEKIMDFDEIDDIESVFEERFHTQFDSYMSSKNQDQTGIKVIYGKDPIIVKPVARRFTTYKTLDLMVSLVNKKFQNRFLKQEDEMTEDDTPRVFANNREKYQLRGFEDEAGDCKVCGVKYKSLFRHMEEPNHVRNYMDHMAGAVSIKNQNAGRPVESCYQFVNRHMKHLEKRSQLLSQLQVLANQLAFREKIDYTVACRFITIVAYKQGIMIRVDSTDQMTRSKSPTLNKPELVQFYREQAAQRGAKIEALCGELDFQQNVEQLSAEFALKLGKLPQRVDRNIGNLLNMQKQGPQNAAFFSLDLYYYQKYSASQVVGFVNFVNFVESLIEMQVNELEELYFDVNQLNVGLKQLELDQVSEILVQVCGFVKCATQRFNGDTYMSVYQSGRAKLVWGMFEGQESERFVVRPGIFDGNAQNAEKFRIRIPRYGVVDSEETLEFLRQHKVGALIEQSQRLLEVKEEPEEASDSAVAAERKQFLRKQLCRSNSVGVAGRGTFSIDGSCVSVWSQRAGARRALLLNQREKEGIFGLEGTVCEQSNDSPALVLQNCLLDGLLAFNGQYGMHFMDCSRILLQAVVEVRRSWQLFQDTGFVEAIPDERTTLHYIEF